MTVPVDHFITGKGNGQTARLYCRRAHTLQCQAALDADRFCSVDDEIDEGFFGSRGNFRFGRVE